MARSSIQAGPLSDMTCCFDALSARIVEQAGCPLTFMSGFSVAAARAGLPDKGLLTVTDFQSQLDRAEVFR
jgi:2-methylisocitrate lyase-like PEP mutase family enzyme